MQLSEDRPVSEVEATGMRVRAKAATADRFTGNARTAPRGSDSRIGDDETHRRLQDARNRARHSTEDMVRRELGPEWVAE
jgi:hypothetical protein